MDETLNPVALSEAKHTVGFRYKELFGAIFILGGLAGLILFVYAVYPTELACSVSLKLAVSLSLVAKVLGRFQLFIISFFNGSFENDSSVA